MEAARHPPVICPFRVQFEKVTHRGQGERRSKWQRRERRHGSDRPVVGTVRHAAGGVFEEATFPPVDTHRPKTRPVARREPPGVGAIGSVFVRVPPRVFSLDVDRAAAVFEIVTALFPHERIPDLPKIDPGMGKLMDEERARVEEIATVNAVSYTHLTLPTNR